MFSTIQDTVTELQNLTAEADTIADQYATRAITRSEYWHLLAELEADIARVAGELAEMEAAHDHMGSMPCPVCGMPALPSRAEARA